MARRNKSWKANDVEEKACNLHKRMKKKAKVNIVKKKLLMHSLPAGQKHDSLAWFFGNKIYIWGKIKICIYYERNVFWCLEERFVIESRRNLICCKLLKVKWKRLKGVQSSKSSFHLSVKMSSCLRLPALFFSSARKT